MRLRTCGAFLVVVLLLSMPALAQEQRGSIVGIVKDSSGAVLPGVSVEASGGPGVTLTAVTDANGAYRFPSLLPGTYGISAALSGFKTEKVTAVAVDLGNVKKVDFTLGVATVEEAVQVTAESPIVDVKSSTKATAIAGDRISLVPHNRDFTSLVTQAPGANQEPKSGGISIDGASASENRYVVDGVETTNILNGTSAKPVVADFVEQVQIKSSGYPAEYGGSTGAVVNVITKSGTNNFNGNALAYWQGNGLVGSCNQPGLSPLNSKGAVTGTSPTPASITTATPVCGVNPTLRNTFANAAVSEYWTYPKDDLNTFEPGGSIGGPIQLNRAWFFVAYQPTLTAQSRTSNAATSGNIAGITHTQTQNVQRQYITADQTTQLGSKLRTRFAFNNSWSKTNGALPGTSAQDAATTNYATGSTAPNWSLSAVADYTAKPNLLLSARYGFFATNSHTYGNPTDAKYTFGFTNVGMAGVPAEFQHLANYTNIPSNSLTAYDLVERKFFQADATWFTHAAGQHEVKAGTQFDLRSENVNSGQQAQNLTFNWGQQFAATGPQGTYGYYYVDSNAVAPREGSITIGNEHSNVVGLFVQDTWAVNGRLTLNLGLRSEQEKVPAYTDANNDYGDYPIQFGFGDKLAPRIGGSYDLRGDGRWKLYGSWGLFYDIFKLNLAQGSFGGAKWIRSYYTLDTADFTSVNQNQGCPPACAGTFITSVDERLPSLSKTNCYGPCLDPDLKPMRSQEANIGLEHQLNNTSSISVRYVHKQLDRGIEDTGSIDQNNGEAYTISNPGEGLTATFTPLPCSATGITQCDAYQSSSGVAVLPKPNREYDAGEFLYTKRLSHSWSLYTSYTLSRLYGNYPGLSESDENGRTSPNTGRIYDYPIEMMGTDGQPLYGVLPTDRTHQFKAQVVYLMPWGTSIGLNQGLASGIPIGRSLSVIPGHSYPIYFAGRDSDGRTASLSQTDLYVQHEFKLFHSEKRFQLNMNVQNLFDQRTPINYVNTVRRAGTTPSIDENAFYAGQVNLQAVVDQLITSGAMSVNQQFLLPSAFQDPRLIRIGAKFTF
jgi:outer membrane receptor protein involved in Fe transport